MPFIATIFTLFPEMFPGNLGQSLAGKALKTGTWDYQAVQLRDFGIGKHKRVDDTPAGGGAGMILRADVIASAIDATLSPDDPRPRYVLSPRGKIFTQHEATEIATNENGIILLCGRYEGIDQRVIDTRGFQEISIGPYVLSGGEPAALIMLDAIIRLLPGVMGNSTSGQFESYMNDTLEHPQYTLPRTFEGRNIPDVLLSGNHENIQKWKQEHSKYLNKNALKSTEDPT